MTCNAMKWLELKFNEMNQFNECMNGMKEGMKLNEMNACMRACMLWMNKYIYIYILVVEWTAWNEWHDWMNVMHEWMIERT